MAVVGCGGTPAGAALHMIDGGTNNGDRSPGQALTPDSRGWIDRSTTGETRMQGAWVSFADGFKVAGGLLGPGDCQKSGHADAECSIVLSTDPASPMYPPTADLGMCLFGVAAKVVPGANGQPDYNGIWGFGFGIDFDYPDWPEPRTLMNRPTTTRRYDALAHGVTGIAFDIDSEPAPRGGIRVHVTTMSAPNQSAWWGGATAESSPIHAGHNEFHWADVGGPTYLPNPPAFDPTQLLGLNFSANSDVKGPVAIAFCINNLTALIDR